jgi:hypothetical protein
LENNAMSNLNAIGLILAILITTMFVAMYATRCAQLRSDGISTGMVRGVRISARARLMILFQEWLSMAVGIAVFNLIVALGLMKIAANLVDPDIKILAWLSAMLSGFACAGWLVQGGLFFTGWLSILRRAEAEEAGAAR